MEGGRVRSVFAIIRVFIKYRGGCGGGGGQ